MSNYHMSIKIFLVALFPILLYGCSETRNLASEETLYVGIKRIDYDVYRSKADTLQREGVITAIGRAYTAVSDLLHGNPTTIESFQTEQLTKHQRDSIKFLRQMDAEAYAEAKAEVEGVLSKAPNNSLLGSSFYRFPLPIGLWIYNNNVYRNTPYGRWMLNNFASTPIYLTTVNPAIRTRVAQNTLRNYGFFRAQVDYDTISMRNPRKAKLVYKVHSGPQFRLDTISYQHFPERIDTLIRASMRSTLLCQGNPFSVKKLDAERTRLSNLLRNNGFFYFQPAFITYRADTLMRPLHVQLQVRPSTSLPDYAKRQYHIGSTRICLYDNTSLDLSDSLTHRDITLVHNGKRGIPPLRLNALRRNMRYHRGQMYSQSGVSHMIDALNSMGVFSQLNVDLIPRDTLDNDTLDVLVTMRLDKPYDSEFKGNLAIKSNGLVGPGVSFSMSRKNAFRGAETVSLELHGSYEWMTGVHQKNKNKLLNSFEYGADLNLVFPRLTMLSLGRHIEHRAITSTTYKISANWLNRSGYYGQVALGGRLTYKYERKHTLQHEFTPFRLDYNMLLHTTARFNEIVQQNPVLYISMRDQFVPSMQYTFIMTSRPNARNPRSLTLDFKEAGNVTSGLYRAFGQDWKRRNKGIFGVPFAQFFKVSAQVTEHYKIRHTRTYLVGRLFAGVALSYGNSTMAPYNELFSVGGANSIRAFGARTLGPGSYHPASSQYSYIDEVGDFKLEANLEYRFPLIGMLGGALFLDAGNVWLLRPDANRSGSSFNPKTFGKEIALGTGFGLRYDLEFLVLRFDVGVGIHAPYQTTRRGYYNMPKFWNSLGYHIAVGYPF